jgi:hypothetical protein
LRGLALLYLPFAFNMPFYALSVFSVVCGLDWIASAPPTVRLLSGVVGAERQRLSDWDRDHGRLDHCDPPDRGRCKIQGYC